MNPPRIPKLIKMSRAQPWKPRGAAAFTSIERALAFKEKTNSNAPIVLICDRRNDVFGNFVGKGYAFRKSQVSVFANWLLRGLGPRRYDRQRIDLFNALPLLQQVDYLACHCGDWEHGQPLIDCHCVITINAFVEAMS